MLNCQKYLTNLDGKLKMYTSLFLFLLTAASLHGIFSVELYLHLFVLLMHWGYLPRQIIEFINK